MSRKWIAVTASLAIVFSTCAFAQDEAGSTAGGASAAAPAQTPDAAGAVTDGAAQTPDATAPNAPLHSADEGPVPAGNEAGTVAASGWMPSTGVIAVAGAAAPPFRQTHRSCDVRLCASPQLR